ncbi:MAG: 30S ribosomal protein S1 [Clostridia bacterium]|nr:30S ribosomal protein S1 [Clostridia bacterium]
MSQGKYLPEGRLGAKVGTREALERAIREGTVLEGRAVRCTDRHELVVDINGIRGIIPREETAIGIDTGRTREIAILSRVGKTVCFKAIARAGDGFILSRKAAQQEALDHYMSSVQTGEIIRCRVTHLENFGAFVDIGCGVISMIGIENISVSRIAHPAERFALRQDIYAVVIGKDPKNGRISLSHKELLGTWEQCASLLNPGETVSGVVRGVEDYGIFVELSPNISGLAEPKSGISIGDNVSVYIKSINPERMKIKLLIIDSEEKCERRLITPRDYYLTEGILHTWRYSPIECEDKIVQTVF